VRLIVATNILVTSALLTGTSVPSQLVVLWREGLLDLLTSVDQLNELMHVKLSPQIHERLSTAFAGCVINTSFNYAIPHNIE
jgi:predicted nucleic acid-binding protein